ncbi:MAG: hypothetical protein APF81_26435 [Desulfosporosinus sp. BRH_c37]|nr:MAG: hypothetical protein APF81_26435 [Desulfosporosinus sp. BRH_c37]
MDNQSLNDAIEDIKLIKQVIDKSTDSFLSLGQIFLSWGVLFLFNTLYVKLFIFESYAKSVLILGIFPYLPGMKFVIFIIIGILIFMFFSHKKHLSGKSKQIMRLWVFVITFNLIVPKVLALHDEQLNMLMFEIKTPILLLTFSLALFFTDILSGINFTKWMGIIYILTAFFAFLPGKISPYFDLIVWPMTFIILGIYFVYRNHLARGK